MAIPTCRASSMRTCIPTYPRPSVSDFQRSQRPHDGCICTTGRAVLRPKDIDSTALAYLLQTDFVTEQLLRNNIGIAYPAIDESCLPDVLLPLDRQELAALSDEARIVHDLKTRLA